VHCVRAIEAGEVLPVGVRVGGEHAHPDTPDHFIDALRLYDGERLLAEVRFSAGLLGPAGGNPAVSFNLQPASGTLDLRAEAHCSRHGDFRGPGLAVQVNAENPDG
jgi:desulfoferrodoxin (superoxide reductase-like protein)